VGRAVAQAVRLGEMEEAARLEMDWVVMVRVASLAKDQVVAVAVVVVLTVAVAVMVAVSMGKVVVIGVEERVAEVEEAAGSEALLAREP